MKKPYSSAAVWDKRDVQKRMPDPQMLYMLSYLKEIIERLKVLEKKLERLREWEDE